MKADSFYNPVAKRPRRVFSKIKKLSPLTRPRTSKTPVVRASVRLVEMKKAMAEIRALKSRVAALESQMREELDIITERLVQLEAATGNLLRECPTTNTIEQGP